MYEMTWLVAQQISQRPPSVLIIMHVRMDKDLT